MARRYRFERGGNHQSDPWLRVGTVGVTTSVLVAALAVLGMIGWAISPAITRHITLVPEDVRRGQVWRLVTWPFANVPSLGGVISIGAFWWFGSQIEGLLQRRRFAWYLGAIVVLPSLVAGAIGRGGLGSTAGMGALSLAMVVAFAIEFPGARFFFNIPFSLIIGVVVAITLLQLIGVREWTGLIIYTVALLVVVTGLRAYGLGGWFQMLPGLPGLRRVAEGSSPARRSGSTRSARPARPGRASGSERRSGGRSDAASKAPKAARSKSPAGKSEPSTVVQGPWSAKPVDQRELDRLLDKIAAQGIDSLSADERKMLDEASRRLRERRDS